MAASQERGSSDKVSGEDLTRLHRIFEGSLAQGRYQSPEEMEAAFERAMRYLGGNSLGDAIITNGRPSQPYDGPKGSTDVTMPDETPSKHLDLLERAS